MHNAGLYIYMIEIYFFWLLSGLIFVSFDCHGIKLFTEIRRSLMVAEGAGAGRCRITDVKYYPP